jgi:hypothetical protein
MNRRDQFANAAMAAILAERPWVIEDESGRTHLAFRAYRMAEAMEREALQHDAMEREARVLEERKDNAEGGQNE